MSVECYCNNPSCRTRCVAPAVGRAVKCKACGETFVATAAKTKDDYIEPAWGEVTKPTATATATGGNTIGRFAIRGKLGSGAFGTVYRAYDPQLDRVVALKVPNPGVMTDAKRAERFLREAKAAANLHHPHIVPVFDAGKDGDSYYIASAFIGGQPLADSIPEGGTEFPRAARLVRELAEALAYAHEQGIVHRDVKPANVMLDTLDRVHLMDFGLASRQEEAGRLTNDGAVMGTPAYMSPEQARGQKGDAQPATDQYAAGVVLYELLAGRTPFGGPPAVVIAAVLTTEPDPPRTLRPDVPKDLETICLKAMSKKPDDRYPSCRELADDLRRWSEGEPVSARPLGFAERAARWAKKDPKLAGAVAAVALVLVASVLVVSAAARRADAALQQANKNAADRDAAQASAEQAAGTTLGAIGTASEERRKAEALVAQVSDEREKAEALQAQLRRLLAERAKLFGFTGHTNRVNSVSFSPCGRWVATGSNDGTAKVWDAKTAVEALTLRGHAGTVTSASFSPDGARIVTGSSDSTAKVWDAKTGVETLTLKGHAGAVTSASFSPDGAHVATGSWDNTAKVWDAKTGAEALTLKGHKHSVSSASFSSDGARIVTGSHDGTAKVWDAKTGAEALTLSGHKQSVNSASFSPDGARIVTGSWDDTAKVWDAKTGAAALTLKGHTATVFSAAFSPDGAQVITGSSDNTARVWDAPPPK